MDAEQCAPPIHTLFVQPVSLNKVWAVLCHIYDSSPVSGML